VALRLLVIASLALLLVVGCSGEDGEAAEPDAGGANGHTEAAEPDAGGANGHTEPVDPDAFLYGPPYDSMSSVDWSLATQGRFLTLAASSLDGQIIYVGSWDGDLYALSMSGEVQWTHPTGGRIHSAPVVLGDGRVVVGSREGHVHVVDASGQPSWTYDTGAIVDHSPAVDPEGRVYVVSQNGTLTVLDRDGEVQWTYDLEAPATTSASVFGDGEDRTIFVATADGAIHCVTNAESAATANVTGHVIGNFALDGQGRAYGGTTQGHIVGVNGGCELLFSVDHTWAKLMPPIIGADGALYAGGHNRHLFKFSRADGSLVWTKPSPVRAVLKGAPVLGANGHVYGAAQGLLRVTAAGDVTVVSEIDAMETPLLIGPGRFILSTEKGYLVSLDASAPALGSSDWPTQQGNQQRTGFLARSGD
jgi:outer membrane protein assembly factor BamB